MKLKKLLIIGLVVMVGLFSQGCGGSDDYEEDVVNEVEEEYEEEEELEEDEEEYEEEEESEGEFVRVGTDDTGYINLPSNWIMMNTVNDEAIDTQYCNQEQTMMVTLMTTDDDGIDAETTSEQMVANRSELGESQTGKGDILGYPAYQSFTQYENGFQELIWFFQVEDGYMQSIIVQGPENEIQLLMDLVNDTFSFEE